MALLRVQIAGGAAKHEAAQLRLFDRGGGFDDERRRLDGLGRALLPIVFRGRALETAAFGEIDPPHQSRAHSAVQRRDNPVLELIDHFSPDGIGHPHGEHTLAQRFRLGSPRELVPDDFRPAFVNELDRVDALARPSRKNLFQKFLQGHVLPPHAVIMSRA